MLRAGCIYNGVTITDYCNEIEMQNSIIERERKTLGSTGVPFRAGIAESQVQLKGDWNATIDALLGRDAFTGVKRTGVATFDDGTYTVRYTWTNGTRVSHWKVTTAAPGKIEWVATLQNNVLGVRSVDVDETLRPLWAIYEVSSGTITSSGLGATASVTSISTSGPVVDKYLWIAPPPNTKRMIVTGTWSSQFASPTGSCGSNVDVLDDNTTTLVDDLVHSVISPATDDGTTSGSFTATFTFPTFATADWPVNKDNYVGASNGDASRFRAYSDTTGTATSTTTVNVTVTEIELDDGTIYTPG